MGYVFLSFTKADIEFVNELDKRIQEGTGLGIWRYDREIETGERWSHEVDTDIDKCSALVVVMTPAAAKSGYVTYEWSFAFGRRVPVLVILHKKTELHLKLSREFQHIDFTHGPKWDEFIKHLLNRVEEHEVHRIRVPKGASRTLEHIARKLEGSLVDAEEGLRSLEDMPVSDPLVQDVLAAVVERSEYLSISIKAAIILAKSGDERATPGLFKALDSGTDRVQVFNLLGNLKDPRIVPRLITELEHASWPGEIDTIVDSLGRIGDKRALPALREVLNTRTVDSRVKAVEAIGRIKDPSAIPDLVEVLNGDKYKQDPQMSRVRATAALALGNFEDTEAILNLREAIRDTDHLVRGEVVVALGNACDKESVLDLIQCLRQEREPRVRASAAYALGMIGDDRAVADLTKSLNITYHVGIIGNVSEVKGQRVCDYAAWALKQIGTQEALTAISEWEARQRQ